MSNKDKDGEIRYCVAAILDLLGFATHLETASNDLRTRIGQEAINRLQVLEGALQLLAEERATCSQEHPEAYHHIRINDAVIFAMDLPDLLRPPVGESVRTGFTPNEILRLFDPDKVPEDLPALHAGLSNDVAPLIRFVGLLARLHSFINRKENSAYFPGARTVIATGYRRPFGTQRNEDFLSANFSFSNAYLAEKHLRGRGPRFFVDDNVSRMLSMNRFARNLLRFACFITRPTRFDPLEEHEQDEDGFYSVREQVVSEPVDVILFKKSFQFRELDPYPLSHLQIVPRLSDYLESRKQPAEGGNPLGTIARDMLKAIMNGPQDTEDSLVHLPGLRMDLEDDIQVFPELIESGESATLKRRMEELHKKTIFIASPPPHKLV